MFINCSGLCNRFVHPECVKINVNVFPMFSVRNIKWFCDDCCEIFHKMSHHMEVMMNTLQSLAADVKSVVKSDTPGPSSERRITRQTKKKTLLSESDSIANPGTPVDESSNNSINPPVNVIFGSCTDVEDNFGLKAVPERKYIYASRFASSTTTESIKKYLGRKLLLAEDEMDCRLLVAANQDVSRYNFISFKIGISPGMFEKLLHPDVWPKGVIIREFIERPKNTRSPVTIH